MASRCTCPQAESPQTYARSFQKRACQQNTIWQLRKCGDLLYLDTIWQLRKRSDQLHLGLDGPASPRSSYERDERLNATLRERPGLACQFSDRSRQRKLMRTR